MPPGIAAALHPGGAAAAVRACRRRVQRGWASHLRWRAPTLTQLPCMGSCKAHATRLPAPDDHRSSLHRKAHGPRGSVEGRPRVNVAVLIGCQVSAGWHAPRRLTARIVMPPRDGERLLSTCVDNGARILY